MEDQAGTARYRMLETVRQYEQAKLHAQGETERVQRRHRAFFQALAEDADPQLIGPQQSAWLVWLEREHDNLRAALAAALAAGEPRPPCS